MDTVNLIRLNIGAGLRYIPDFINIDLSKKADMSLDLNIECLPFNDNTVDLVFTNHTIEHLDNYLFALAEIHRVLKHGGKLLVGVPYVTLTEYNLINPYHKQHFNEYSFDFFEPDKLLNSAAEDRQILFKKISHRFHYLPEFKNETDEKKDFARRHYFNVVKEITFGILAIKDKNIPLEFNEDTGQELLSLYDQCMKQRVKY
jgi:ubiquinone/menaquinone biosynthesis C-methylase UbiE